MEKKLPIFLMILVLMYGCYQGKDRGKEYKQFHEEEEEERTSYRPAFVNQLIKDTTLVKTKISMHMKLANAVREDSIVSRCDCEKNREENSIKIQLMTAIPTKKELDTMTDRLKKRKRLLQFYDLGYLRTIDGQFKFITLVLKDSLVDQINLFSKSTNADYNGAMFDAFPVKRYKINISTFDYSIASNVYGNVALYLDREFGLFEKDTIIKSAFVCTNGKIKDREQIKNWDIKKDFEKRADYRGFRVNP